MAGNDGAGRRDYEDLTSPDQEPDVVVDVDRLDVEEIDLEVRELHARVSLNAEVLDLLRLNVGLDADLSGLRLDIKGIGAQALLRVRLENVARIIEHVLSTIEKNPQIVETLARNAATAVDRVGESATRALPPVADRVGRTTERVGERAADVGDQAAGAARDVQPGPAVEAASRVTKADDEVTERRATDDVTDDGTPNGDRRARTNGHRRGLPRRVRRRW